MSLMGFGSCGRGSVPESSVEGKNQTVVDLRLITLVDSRAREQHSQVSRDNEWELDKHVRLPK